MKKVILTKGLPASGKTTWAKKLINKHPNMYKRVNKDDLREMLDNSKWSKSSEKFILKIRDNIILEALDFGKHVIVDDTNLHPKHEINIKELVKEKAVVEIKDFTDVPLQICIERDLKREKSVGKKVIKNMYNSFLKKDVKPPKYNPELPDIVICDLDGTLALHNGRNPYDASTCDQDLLNAPVADIINHEKFILVSGREDKYRKQTLKFLTKYNIRYSKLLMRKTGDFRNDAIVKKEIYEKYIKDKYNVKFVLDDRNRVVEMWRSLGLTCLQVADGDF